MIDNDLSEEERQLIYKVGKYIANRTETKLEVVKNDGDTISLGSIFLEFKGEDMERVQSFVRGLNVLYKGEKDHLVKFAMGSKKMGNGGSSSISYRVDSRYRSKVPVPRENFIGFLEKIILKK